MDIEGMKPFLKVGGIVLGLAIFGAISKCALSSSANPCEALPIAKVNVCIERARLECAGADFEACRAKIVNELK